MAWFKNLRTLAKLMLAFGLISVFLLIVGYTGISSASSLNGMLQTLYERDMMGLSAMKEANLDRIRVGRDVRSALIATDKSQIEQDARLVESRFASMHDELGKVEKTLTTDASKEELAKINDLLPGYENTVKDTLRLAASGNTKEAVETLDKAQAEVDQVDRLFNSMATRKEKIGKEGYDQSAQLYSRVRTILVAVLCFAVLLSMVIGYFIAELISRPLLETVRVLEKVAQGDLTQQLAVETKDEVGKMAESLNEATEAMRIALSEVRKSAESMASSSQELASASEELSSGAQEQASSLEETTATLEQITSTVKQNADNAKQANQVASGSRDTAEKGGQVVSDAVAAMGEINEASNNIAEIITAIDEIAFQTNLLALNAAVEAARAGEQGRGFAVVATEVRNLAQRSATSAKEIKRLIQDSVRKVENGSGLVNKSGETLNEIVGSVKKVTDIVAEIAAASREQSTGIEQVNKAMVQMDQVTQANASQTEELSATAQNLSVHAQQLQALVERFRLDSGTMRRSYAAVSNAEATAKPAPAKNAGGNKKPHAQVAHAASAFVPGKVKPNGHDVEANAFEEF